jgi:hypothetical protein
VVDPYDWLGVPKGPRPPTHYQLLGLDPAATDPVAIRAAADRQLRRLLPHLTGPDALAAEQAWTELEEARDTLLDPARRAHYDATVPVPTPAPATVPAPAPEPAAPDISAFEEPPPAASGPPPWWKALPEPVAAGRDPWWKQPLPAEPPAALAPVAATDVHTSTVSLPVARPAPAGRPTRDLVPEPRPPRRRTNPVLVGFLGLVVAGLIGGGMYYAFGRKHNPPAPKVEPAPDLTQVGPKPRPIDDAPKADEPVVAEGPLPKDFAEQLRPRTFAGHAGAVNGIAVARSGSRFATVGADRTLRLWSVTKEAFLVRHTFTAPAVGVAWADDDRRLLAADGFVVGLFNPLNTKPPSGFESPRGGVTALAVTPDGNRALTGLTDGYLRLWDTAAGRPDEWPAAARGSVTAVDISSDGTRALVAVQDGSVSVWHLASRGKADEWTSHPGGAIAVQFSPNGKLAATAGTDGSASVYDLAGKREVSRLSGHAAPVTGVAWQGGGRQLVTVGADGTARLWHAETGQPIRWVQTLSGKGTCVAVDPGDRFVLAGTASGTVHLFPLPRVRGEAVADNLARPPADPLPVPDPEAVATALGAVRTELAKEYRYTRADDVSILADNLRRRAGVENVPPPVRYGLLQEARALAVKAGDPTTAVRAVEDLTVWFDVDELAEKASALAALAADVDPLALVSTGLAAAERAETDARPEVVERILYKLPPTPEVPKELGDRLTAIRQRAAAATRERQAVGRALDLLRNAPDDPGANQTVGLYLCLARQDWAAGLPHLVKGSDPRLIDAARLDLSNPTDPKARNRLGELWFAFAADARDHRSKRAYLGRARLWLERESKAKLEVADEIKVRARLDDIAKLDVPGKDPGTLPLLTPVVVRRAYNTVNPGALASEWKLDGGAAGTAAGVLLPAGEPVLRSTFGLAPGGRLTLSFRPDGRQVRLFLAGQEVPFAAAGKTFRVAIERKDTAVTLTGAGVDGEAVSRTVELPPASRGPVPVAVRLAGMATRQGGTLLTAAMARGPASLPPPTPE